MRKQAKSRRGEYFRVSPTAGQAQTARAGRERRHQPSAAPPAHRGLVTVGL